MKNIFWSTIILLNKATIIHKTFIRGILITLLLKIQAENEKMLVGLSSSSPLQLGTLAKSSVADPLHETDPAGSKSSWKIVMKGQPK